MHWVCFWLKWVIYSSLRRAGALIITIFTIFFIILTARPCRFFPFLIVSIFSRAVPYISLLDIALGGDNIMEVAACSKTDRKSVV